MWIAGCWAVSSVATGWLMIVASLMFRTGLPFGELVSFLIYGLVLATVSSAWGVGRIETDVDGERAIFIGGFGFPLRRLRSTLSWSCLYIPMLLCWTVLIGDASARFYIVPSIFVGLVFGGIVATFVDEHNASLEKER